MDFTNLAATANDGEGVLGKILYYSLSSVLIDREKLTEICDSLGFPYSQNRKVALSDAFRSATGDIYDSKKIGGIFGTEHYKIYCRDNKAERGVISRELVKETLDRDTNEYKKLANITFSKDAGIAYDDLVYDEHVNPLDYCNEAVQLFELYQTCAGRKQIETLLEAFIASLNASKLLARGKMFFIPRDKMNQLDVFEELIRQIEENNRHENKHRYPLDCNSIHVVNDAKQREKMAAAFYNSVRREIAEYSERVEYFIKSGSQSPAIMERWVLKIQSLTVKKREYEDILKRELGGIDDELKALGYLADELQIRAHGLRTQKAA